jgi:hypothetical protein
VVAHYAHAGDGSPGVIRVGELAERVCRSAATTTHPTNTERLPPPLKLALRIVPQEWWAERWQSPTADTPDESPTPRPQHPVS